MTPVCEPVCEREGKEFRLVYGVSWVCVGVCWGGRRFWDLLALPCLMVFGCPRFFRRMCENTCQGVSPVQEGSGLLVLCFC